MSKKTALATVRLLTLILLAICPAFSQTQDKVIAWMKNPFGNEALLRLGQRCNCRARRRYKNNQQSFDSRYSDLPAGRNNVYLHQECESEKRLWESLALGSPFQFGSLTTLTRVPGSIDFAPAGTSISAVARANATKSDDPPHFKGSASRVPCSSARRIAGK